MRPNQADIPRLDADTVYMHCLLSLREELPNCPAPSSMQLNDLLWFLTVSMAHATEIAGRVFGSLQNSDPLLAPKQIAPLLLQDGLPSKREIYDLWLRWDKQYPDWPLSDTLKVPFYFCLCLMRRLDCRIELNRRLRKVDLPVFKSLMGVTAGPAHPDAFRLKRFFDAMDTTLQSTVARRLRRTQSSLTDDAPTASFDEENIALAGATEMLKKGEANILKLFSKEESILHESGQPIRIPSIPVLPIRGMEEAEGLNKAWRDNAQKCALRGLAAVAPGFFGLLETALSDAAHAAQRAAHDLADAKMRGGTGGVKAKKTNAAQPAVQYISIGEPPPESESPDEFDCVDPMDDRLNQQQEIEEHEEEAADLRLAKEAYRIAYEHWGESGLKMLEAYLVDGATDKTAAKAAGITPQAVRKRLNTLRKKTIGQ